jgi:hypothetical protein
MTDGDLMRAGRTVTGMSASTSDQRMVEEFLAGADVADIAARYAVPEAYVDRVIEETHLDKPRRSWSLTLRGNRIVLALAVAWIAWLLLQTPALYMENPGAVVFCLLVGLVFYAIISATVGRRR